MQSHGYEGSSYGCFLRILDWQMMFELWRNLGWSLLASLSLKYSRGLTLGEQKGVEEFEVQDFALYVRDGHIFLQQLNWSRELRLRYRLKSYNDFLCLDWMKRYWVWSRCFLSFLDF